MINNKGDIVATINFKKQIKNVEKLQRKDIAESFSKTLIISYINIIDIIVNNSIIKRKTYQNVD